MKIYWTEKCPSCNNNITRTYQSNKWELISRQLAMLKEQKIEVVTVSLG